MNKPILEQHQCVGKCTDLKEKGDCGHCMVPEKVCLSNFAKNETQSDLSLESGSQFKVGDYVVAKDTYNTNELFHIERKGSFGGMNDIIAQEVAQWIADGNKPTQLSNTGEVYARGRAKDVVEKEAKHRNKSTFFFGCPVHGETRFCTVRRKCVACSGVVANRSEGKDHA